MFDKGNSCQGVVLFAHGAGAGMDHPFMLQMDELLAAKGLQVIRFEFPYMTKRREDGKKRPPDRMPVLLAHYKKQIESVIENTKLPVYIAGKSMGGRVASMLLDDTDAKACFAFGYPFHPPRKPESLRTEHLVDIEKPVYIFQGTRDAMGNQEEVLHYALSESVHLHWLEDGDHDLKPRKASGYSQTMHLEQIAQKVEEIIS
ncbi:alpha/beta hydrolase [Pontibacterium sp. N1Y112]|uniref:Alpha/beta hydrolase n=1 Tax=Pontibacterium sinense TaxID=2781979 RepID=A0A8J7FUJ6_9GAMM|nr:alpha/beta family hydrolase [Pontibacterium sinense]MBE9399672.1 alpha/beta hydrolase [Pontibacterium sinense]